MIQSGFDVQDRAFVLRLQAVVRDDRTRIEGRPVLISLQAQGTPSESFNYWGQLAMRNCFRQAYNGGAIRGGTCTATGGLDGLGEPGTSLH